MKFNYHKVIVSFLMLILLCGCSSSSSSGAQPSSGDAISMVAPLLYQLSENKSDDIAYLDITNNKESQLTVSIAATDLVGGVNKVNLNQEICSNIRKDRHCLISYTVIDDSKTSGSFRLNVIDSNSNILLGSRVVGVQAPLPDTKLSGANGVSMFFKKNVNANIPSVIMTGVVSSSNGIKFNQAELIDGVTGKPLVQQKWLSGNLGPDATLLGKGDQFSIEIPVGTGISYYRLKLSNSNTGVYEVSNNQYANMVLSEQAIVHILPQNVNLTESNSTQYITIYNAGDRTARLKNLVVTDSNIETDFTVSDLLPNQTKLVKLSLKKIDAPQSTQTLTLLLDNAKGENYKSISVQENFGSANFAAHGLSLFLSSNQFFGASDTDIVNTLNIYNSSMVAENNFQFTLPSGFSIQETNTPDSCKVNSENTISNVIGAGKYCELNIIYKATASELKQANITLKYSYDTGLSDQLNIPVLTKTVADSANLILVNKNGNFGRIKNNNHDSIDKEFVIQNTGGADAQNMNYRILGTATSFSITNLPQSCGAVVKAHSSCAITVRFGPSSETGDKNAKLAISSSAQIIGSVNLNGTVSAPEFDLEVSDLASGFTTGSGTESKPYFIQSGGAASVNYTFTNNSNESFRPFYVENLGGAAWGSTINQCGSKSSPTLLEPHTTCAVTYTLASGAAAGSNDISVSGSWINKEGKANSLTSDTTYVQVYASPHIIVSATNESCPIECTLARDTLVGDTLKVNFKLVGGYKVSDTSVSLENIPGEVSYSSDRCIVNSESNECNIWITIEPNTALRAQQQIQLDSELPISESSITFSELARHVIVYTLNDRRDVRWFSQYMQQHNYDPLSYNTQANMWQAANEWCQQYAESSAYTSDFPIKRYRYLKYVAIMESQVATTAGVGYYQSHNGLVRIAVANSNYLVGFNRLESAIRPELPFESPLIIDTYNAWIQRYQAFTGAYIGHYNVPDGVDTDWFLNNPIGSALDIRLGTIQFHPTCENWTLSYPIDMPGDQLFPWSAEETANIAGIGVANIVESSWYKVSYEHQYGNPDASRDDNAIMWGSSLSTFCGRDSRDSYVPMQTFNRGLYCVSQ